MKCWIDRVAAGEMFREATSKDPLETGGCLMGYWANESEVVVCYIVGPGPAADHRRMTFEPDYEFQCSEVGRIYDESERKLTYLGDWHTHPGGCPFPSGLDVRALKRIASSKEARALKPLMIILGGFGSFSEQAVYVLIDGSPLSIEVFHFDFDRSGEAVSG